MNEVILQKWTAKRILCYLVYRLVARQLPEVEELSVIGEWSQKLRGTLCRSLFNSSGKGIGIGRGVAFGTGSNIIMRDYANLGAYAHVSGSRAFLTVGKHVMMGSRCMIILQNHKWLEEGFEGFEGKDVVIDDHAWIGHNVIILPGVRIGCHAIVGAGSVVTKDVPDYAIAAGNPATIKKYRKLVAY